VSRSRSSPFGGISDRCRDAAVPWSLVSVLGGGGRGDAEWWGLAVLPVGGGVGYGDCVAPELVRRIWRMIVHLIRMD
jgi:hypothetical protein